MPEVPAWLTAVIAAAVGLIGNVLPSISEGKRSDNKLLAEREAKLHEEFQRQIDEGREYYAKIVAESEQTRLENARLFQLAVDVTAKFSEFQMMMLREAIQISIHLDGKDSDAAQMRLDGLIKHIKELRIDMPAWNGGPP